MGRLPRRWVLTALERRGCWWRGMTWGVKLRLRPEDVLPGGTGSGVEQGAAGVFLSLRAPLQLGRVEGVAWAHARIVVHSYSMGRRCEAFAADYTSSDVIVMGGMWGWVKALNLQPAAAGGSGSGALGGIGGEDAEVAAQLARFAEWMHEGRITSIITFRRPPSS